MSKIDCPIHHILFSSVQFVKNLTFAYSDQNFQFLREKIVKILILESNFLSL